MYHRPVPRDVLPPVSFAYRQLWLAACRGEEPAESLTTRDREDLVYALVLRGWSDVEVAGHTRMTLYTLVRIRLRLGLFGNPKVNMRGAA